jgi:hypothetical protein
VAADVEDQDECVRGCVGVVGVVRVRERCDRQESRGWMIVGLDLGPIAGNARTGQRGSGHSAVPTTWPVPGHTAGSPRLPGIGARGQVNYARRGCMRAIA